MKNRILKAVSLSCVVAAMAMSGTATGDEGNEKRFAESQVRNDNMKAFGAGFKRISAIMKREAGSPAEFPTIAAKMADAASKAKATFELDTRGYEGYTHAKDAIWENWDDFASRLDKLDTDAQAFLVATQSGDMAQIGPAMQALGSNCKSCHDKYKDD